MKKWMLIFSAAFLLLSCAKNSEQPVIKGKLIYRSCASVVVQVLDTQYYSVAQNSWRQSESKPEYQNVFSVSNECSFPSSITENQDFNFRIINDDPKNKDCVLCAMFDNPPAKTHLIEVIEGGK